MLLAACMQSFDTLTIADVARLLRVSPDTVYRLAASGELPGRKIGRVWRFSGEAIKRHLDPDATNPRMVEAANGPRRRTP